MELHDFLIHKAYVELQNIVSTLEKYTTYSPICIVFENDTVSSATPRSRSGFPPISPPFKHRKPCIHKASHGPRAGAGSPIRLHRASAKNSSKELLLVVVGFYATATQWGGCVGGRS
jgi:hypothetical protein